MSLEEVKQTFLLESRSLLEAMEHALLDLERDFTDEENLNALFRAAHTIKGSGGMFGYSGIVEFTHVLENFLDKVRKGKIQLNSDWTATLLQCHDHILSLVEFYIEHENEELSEKMTEDGQKLLDVLNQSLDANQSTSQNGSSEEETTDDSDDDLSQEMQDINLEKQQEETSLEQPSEDASEEKKGNPFWHISLRFKEDVFRHGMDPLSFVHYLGEMGTIENVMTVVDSVPIIDNLNAESCFLGFEISLQSDKDKESIEQVFEFLLDDTLLTVLPPYAPLSLYLKMVEKWPEDFSRGVEMLLEMEVLDKDDIKSLKKMAEEKLTSANRAVKAKQEEIAQKTASDDKKNAGQEVGKYQNVVQRYIRIDANKLDTLINQVGELVITSSNVRQLSEQSGIKNLTEATSMMNRLVEDIRDISMNIRMVQIGETFRKFERVVHDLSREMNKKISLDIRGGETELDKTVVEKISDPLIHLIRNAIDHGIDTAENRIEAGKPETGKIILNAYHDTGNIVVEVSDDGNGLNTGKILAKALSLGLVHENQNLNEKEIHSLIFEAGFSTAEKVTNVSGRGVGMDVVRRNVESLRGSIDVESVSGEGTTIRVYLPLTLAIIDGFLAKVGKAAYVLPLDMVLECIDLSEEHRIGREGGNFINLRGEVLPFLNLREFFNLKDDEEEIDEENQSIIVVNYARQKAGLVVDELFGEFQTVIKPLGKIFRNLQGISGATILGTGEVALILDVPRLISSASKIQRREKIEQFDLKEE